LHKITLINAGRSDYRKSWDLQKRLFEQVAKRKSDQYLIITEHEPVITIGKTGSKSNLLAEKDYLTQKKIDVVDIDRGGDITFHGPGQIVGYPILDLALFKKDIHWYLRALEDVIIKVLAEYNITAIRDKKLTGVWVNNKKICALGIKTSSWITMHGFALNVQTNLDYFDLIVPCGINDKGVTSISEQVGNSIEQNDVINKLIIHFQNVFNVAIVPGENPVNQLY